MYHSCSIKEHRQSVTEIIWLFQLLKHWALKGNVFFWIGFPLVSHPVWVLMAIRSFLTSIIDLRQADAIPKTRKMELSVHFQGVQRIDRSRVNGDWVGGWGQMVYYWGKAGRFQAKNTCVGIALFCADKSGSGWKMQDRWTMICTRTQYNFLLESAIHELQIISSCKYPLVWNWQVIEIC